ncbi:MAG: hypothetical protein JRJ85_25685 [Deltaproteobacteria bacterium]|nr:hypothetical protein [Deltaproteobacteria bacterium]
MGWMETIKVQSATDKKQIIENELMVLSREIQKNPEYQGLRKIMVLSHALVPGLFAMHLFWDMDDPHPGGSLLGMNLSQNLKTNGIVDHSIWVETK